MALFYIFYMLLQITMVTTNGTTAVGGDQSLSAALQGTQQATHVTLQQLQQSGLAGVSMGEGGQIYVVTDPAQLEALQVGLSYQSRTKYTLD